MSLQILLIEDNVADVILLKRELRQLYDEIEVTHVSTCAEGLAALRGPSRFDIIISDLGLPDTRGLEGIEAVLAQAPSTPLLVLTGFDDTLSLQALTLGVQDYISKDDARGPGLRRAIAHALHRGRVVSRLRESALTDPLTDVRNRAELLCSLEATLDSEPLSVSMLMMDLDRFKNVNDTYGHAVGDALLCTVSERICRLAGDAAVARLGGDEFAVVVVDAGAGEVAALCERLCAALSAPYHLGEVTAHIGVSIGAARGERGDTVSCLMSRADASMYVVKQQHQATGSDCKATALYSPGGERCGVSIAPNIAGRWSAQQTTHWLRIAAAHTSGEPGRVFLFVPADVVQQPGFPRTLSESLAASGAQPSSLVVMLCGLGASPAPLSRLQSLREQGLGLGIADLGAPSCGVSLLLHRPDFVSLFPPLLAELPERGLAKVLVGGLLASCHEAGVRTVLPPGTQPHAMFWTRRLISAVVHLSGPESLRQLRVQAPIRPSHERDLLID